MRRFKLSRPLHNNIMWIVSILLGIFISIIDASGPDDSQSQPRLTWDGPRLKYDNYSFMALLPNPDSLPKGAVPTGAWNATVLTDFDNVIPTFEYTNSSGDLASAASGMSASYAKGWGPEARQYSEDYSKAYMPLVTYFDVKCDKHGMHVHIEFNKPFNGIIFSKGFFNTPDCRYVGSKSYGKIFDFSVPVDYCGTSGEDHSYDYKDSYYENTIIIQFDEYIQEVWDLAKTIRCEWNAYYDKSVAVRPYNVGNLDPVLYRFNGDNIESWIQVQKGKGPWSEEVYGIVKVGDPLTLVIGIRDNEGKFDMQVKDCFATDGYGARVQLTDYYGCVVRGKIMSPFRKVKDYGPQATVVAYAYFQAFKFPDRYEVGIKCNIQVCLGKCQGGCPGDYGGGGGGGEGYSKAAASYENEPGYPAPPVYGNAPKGDYSSVNPVQHQDVDLSQFGPGPYVPDVPSPPKVPSGPPGPYQGSYDTNHVIGIDTAISAAPSPSPSDTQPSVSDDHLAEDTNFLPPPQPPPKSRKPESSGNGNGPTLDPYRRKRDVNQTESIESTGTSTSTSTSASTTTVVTVTLSTTTNATGATTTSETATDKVLPRRFQSGKSARIPKIILDDGQFNLDGKFKVIAPHDIQSDNINAGPQEVSVVDSSSICIGVASFTVGVTLLVSVLVLSVLITFFVCFRMRRYAVKLNGLTASSTQRATRKTRISDFVSSTTCWSPAILAVQDQAG